MKIDLLSTMNIINHVKVENNNFIQKIKIPDDYWSYTMSLSKLEKINNENKIQLESQKKGNDYHYKFLKTKQLNAKDSFLRPREDWDISQGDFIINEKKEIKRKFFTQQDWKNFKNSFWYLLISFVIVFYTLQFISKIS